MSSGKGRYRRGLAWGSALVCGLPSIAWAQATADAEGPRVQYEAVVDCPTATDFTQRLATRTAAHRASDPRTAPTLTVRVTRRDHAPRVHGELSVRYADGTEATRVLDGDACDSVVDALALMSAMALDPDAAPAAPPPPAPVTEQPVAAVPLDAALGWHVGVGAGGGAAFAFAPVVAPYATAFVDVARGGASLVAPALRLGFEYGTSATVPVRGGHMQLVRTLGVVEGCPLSVRAAGFRFTPCGRFEAGALDASGSDVTPSKSSLRPWVAPGLVGRVRYVLPPRVFFELSGGVVAPLVRDHFYFDPADATAFRPPVVSGFVGGALGVTIR